MAPKRKGTSSQNKGRKPKVAKVEPVVDPLEEKIQSITDTIKTYEDDACITELLTNGAHHAFETPKDKRHKFYDTFIGMIDTTLKKFVSEFQKEVETLKVDISQASTAQAEKSSRRERLVDALEKKNMEISQKQAELSGKEESLKATSKQLKAKRAEKMKVCGPLNALEVEQDEATNKYNVFVKLRDEPSSMNDKDRKKLVTALTLFLKTMKADPSLIQASSVALISETRTGFAASIVGEIATLFDKYRNTLKEKIASEGEQHSAIISDVQEAESATTAAKDAVDSARGELQVLEGGRSELEQEKKEAEKDIKAHDKQTKQADENLEASIKKLEEVQKVYADMIEIRDRVSSAEEPQRPQQEDSVY